jgi:O-antigen ligase
LVRGLPFWLFAALLVFSPLPFASVYAVCPPLYGVVIAVAILAFVLQRWRLGRALTLPPLVVLLLLMNLFLSGDQTAARFAHLFDNGDGRFDVYPLMQQAIAERPWTGYGLGSFESAFRLVRDEHIAVLFRRGHSDYLELAMEIGWPATIALISAFGLLFAAAVSMSIRRDEFELALLFVAATVQVGLHSLVDFSMQMPAVVFAYLFLAGLAFGSAAQRASAEAGWR